MKFRALNLDYHAEATSRLAELKGSRNGGQKYILLQAGCYETLQDEETAPQSRESVCEQRHQQQNDRWLESNALDCIDSTRSSTRKSKDAVLQRCSSEEATKQHDPTVLLADTPMEDAPKDKDQICTEIADASIETMMCDDDDEATTALIAVEEEQDNIKKAASLKKQAKPPSRLLTAGELLCIFQILQQETKILRLANEPWNDDIPNRSRPRQVPKLPFWREPEHFLPASVAAMDCGFVRLPSTLVGPPGMETVVRTLAHVLRVKDDSHTIQRAPSFSFSMFGMLRGELGDFGLRRVNQEKCKSKLAAERTAIVVYKGPRHQQVQPPLPQTLPAEWICAVQLAMAALRHNVVVSTADTDAAGPSRIDNKRGADALEDCEKQARGGAFAQFLQRRKNESVSALSIHQSGSSSLDVPNRQSQVSFADSVVRKNKSEEAATSKALLNFNSSSQDQQHQAESGGTEQFRETDEKDRQKKKRKKERTKEEKAARKKERKARKEKRRQEKKRKRHELGEDKVDESSKLVNKKQQPELPAQSNVVEKSQRRQTALPRSVIAKKTSSRRVSVGASGDDELDKARNTLNNKARESRKAFSQMKIPRSKPSSQVSQPWQSSQQKSSLQSNVAQHPASRGTLQALMSQNHFHGPTTGMESSADHKPPAARTNPTLPPPPFSASNNFQGEQRPMPMTRVPSSRESHHQNAPSQKHSGGFSNMQQHPSGVHPPMSSVSLADRAARDDSITATFQTKSTAPEDSVSSFLYKRPTQSQGGLKETKAMDGKAPRRSIKSKNQTSYQQNLCAGDFIERENDPCNHPSIADQGRAPGPLKSQSNATQNDSLLPPIKLLCSENFLEAWSATVAELASGRWASLPADTEREKEFPIDEKNSPKGRKISLIDTALVGACGVDIESPGRCGYLIFAVSALESQLEAKQIVKEVAVLAAIGRYSSLCIYLCHDVPITMPIAKHIVQLQCAVLSDNGMPPTNVCFKTATPASLSASLASSILGHPKSSPGGKLLEEEAIEAATNARVQERSRFLLSLLPVLSATGAIQCLLMAKKMLPPGSPSFRMLFQNQRLRQQIMLAATSGNGSEVHPNAMLQLSRVVRAFKDTDSSQPQG